jgi:hypothetical protein
MRGTSFPGDKLTGDPGNEFGALFIGDRANFCFLTKKSVPNNFGLLQQYRPRAAIVGVPPLVRSFWPKQKFHSLNTLAPAELHKD